MKNWQSTIGGAFSAMGDVLIGIGLVPQLSGVPSKFLTYVVVAGLLCRALGAFFTGLWSADAKQLKEVAAQVDRNTTAIKTGDTTFLEKPATEPTTKGTP